MMGLLTTSANASDAVLLHAAGSLRGALTEVRPGVREILGAQGAGKVRCVRPAQGRDCRAAPRRRCLRPRTWSIRRRWRRRARADPSFCSREINCARWFAGACRDRAIRCSSACSTRKSNWEHRRRRPIRPATMPSRSFARRRRFGRMPGRRWRRRRCSSPAAPPAPHRRPGAMPMAGILPKAAPTFSWPIAPPPAMRRRKIPACRPSRCRTRWRSARITA